MQKVGYRSSEEETNMMVKGSVGVSSVEKVMTAVSFVTFMYLLMGIQVWVAILAGAPMRNPGLLYEPAVALIQMLR